MFNHQQFGRIRCLDRDGQTWFVGKDVAQSLGYKDTHAAIRDHVDAEDRCYVMIESKPTGQNDRLVYKSRTILINESGLSPPTFPLPPPTFLLPPPTSSLMFVVCNARI